MYRLCVYVYKPLPPGFYPIANDKYISKAIYHYIVVQACCVLYLRRPVALYTGAGVLCLLLVQACCIIYWCRSAVSYIGAGLLHYIMLQAFCVLYWCRPVALYTGAGLLCHVLVQAVTSYFPLTTSKIHKTLCKKLYQQKVTFW
jgi:hypothetical protein